MKAIPLFPLVALVLAGCQDVTQPVELDPPSLSHVVGSNMDGVIQLADIGGASTIVGRTIIITDPTATAVNFCGDSFLGVRGLVINPGGGRAIGAVAVGINPTFTIEPGSCFLITADEACDGTLALTLVRQ